MEAKDETKRVIGTQHWTAMRKILLIDGAIVLTSFLVGAYFYHLLPDPMPSHWGPHGADGYGSRFAGVITVPVLMTFMVALLVSVPWLGSFNPSGRRFLKYYEMGIIILPVVVLTIYVQTLLWAMGFTVRFILPCVIGAVIYSAGAILAGSEDDNRVHDKHHRVAAANVAWWKARPTIGVIFGFSALVALSGIFLPIYKPYLITIPVVIASLYTTIYALTLPIKTKTGG